MRIIHKRFVVFLEQRSNSITVQLSGFTCRTHL